MVCEKDFELRNPQDLLRIPKDDPSVPWSRPSTDIIFTSNLITDANENLVTDAGDNLVW